MTLAGPSAALRPGPTNSLTDVAGVRVGHHGRSGDGWLTGTTVVLAPPGGAIAGVDVRGGGPGTHETDALDPRNLVERVHAIVLGGGSAYGLAAVSGVMDRLADAGEGFPVGPGPGEVVPIVPAAILFDLGRGGVFRNAPDASFGAAAYDAATAGPVPLGSVGAGTGAFAGAVKGGVGSASAVLPDGVTVAALAVVNASGATFEVSTGELYGARHGLAGEFDGLRVPPSEELTAAAKAFAVMAAEAAGRPGVRPLNTTIGVVATDAALTKGQCQRLAGVAHDGMARAIHPVHSLFDGDTVFALATGAAHPGRDNPAPGGPGRLDAVAVNAVLAAGADAFSRAVVHGVLAATTGGGYRSYADVFPSAVRDWRR